MNYPTIETLARRLDRVERERWRGSVKGNPWLSNITS